MNETKYRVWALLPWGVGWRLVAPAVTAEHADIYFETLAFPVSVEPAV